MTSALSAVATAIVLQVGRCRVETASREITGPSSPRVRRVTPKAMAVLRLLAVAGGQVVTRESLLAGVWPDSAPTDDVLTQAVTQLRKAFAAADGSEPYIETIARSGYRLLVPVAVMSLPATPDAPEPGLRPTEAGFSAEPPRRRRRVLRRWLLIALAVALVLAIAMLSWLLWQQRSQAQAASSNPLPVRPYRLLTSSLETETHPALSPAGDQLAYTAVNSQQERSQIFVRKRLANSPLHVLSDTPPQAHDRLPSWSPDGSQIAFARFHGDGRCQLMLAAADGQQLPVELLDCSSAELLSFDFSADGRALVIGSFSAQPGRAGIALFHIAERRWQPLDYPRQPGDLDYNPRISPDGRWLVFARNPQLGRLYMMPAGGGALQPLDPGLMQIRGLSWLSDSRHIVVGRRIGMEARLQQLDTRQPGVWRDLGVEDAQLPAAARQVPMLAFMQRRAQTGLLRYGRDQPPQRIYPSVGRELAPALSADGQQLLLFSDRSGVPAVWQGRGDGRGALRLVLGVQPDVRQQAVWDRNGQHALLIGQDQAQRSVLYELSGAGTAVPLPVPVSSQILQAAYTDSANQLLVLERADDRGRLRLFDRDRTPWQELARLDGVSQLRWDRSGGRVLFTRFDRPGLFAWDTASGQTAVVNTHWPTRWRYRSWEVSADGSIWYSQIAPHCRNALRLLNPQPQQRASGQDLRCLDRRLAASFGGFSSAEDGALLMAVAEREGGDIGLMPLFDTAEAQLEYFSKRLIP